MMRTSRAITSLSLLIATLALVAAGVGLFSRGGGPYPFTTLHGETVQLYGRGLYRSETLFVGALNPGTDAIVLVLGIPLLLGPTFVAQTISQVSAGVSFTPGEIVGPIGGFGCLSLVAIGLLVALPRAVGDTASSRHVEGAGSAPGGAPQSHTGTGIGVSQPRAVAPPTA